MFRPRSRSHPHSHSVSLVSFLFVVVTVFVPFVSSVAAPVIDQAIYIGSTPLHSHINLITNLIDQIYHHSDAPKNETVIKYTPPDIKNLLQDQIYIGNACWNHIADINNTIEEHPITITTCIPLHDIITTSFSNTSSPNLDFLSNLTSLYITSNIRVKNALDPSISKDPEIMIIQDQRLLPLYSVYRNKSLAPALHSLLTLAPALRHVYLLPSWADPDPSNLGTAGLSYDDRAHMQHDIDLAYNEIEHELHEWIEARGYPVNITSVRNEIVTQTKPTLVTIPVSPVFDAIINELNWTIPIFNITYTNQTEKIGFDGDLHVDQTIAVPSIVTNNETHHVTGTDLLYDNSSGIFNSTSIQLTPIGSYVLSLLLFSSIYSRSPIDSFIPNVTRDYDIIEYPIIDPITHNQTTPEKKNKDLFIPYITNQTAIRIQQIVYTELIKRNVSMVPYFDPIIPIISSTGDLHNSTSNSSSSSSSSSDNSSSSSINSSTGSSSSSSSTAVNSTTSSSSSPASSSSTATAITDGNNQDHGESTAQGIKGYWALIIGGIVGLSILLYCCYRKKQKHALRQGYGHMQFDMDKGYEVELQQH